MHIPRNRFSVNDFPFLFFYTAHLHLITALLSCFVIEMHAFLDSGGVESGFFEVEEAVYDSRLYLIVADPRVRIIAVPLHPSSLHSGLSQSNPTSVNDSWMHLCAFTMHVFV